MLSPKDHNITGCPIAQGSGPQHPKCKLLPCCPAAAVPICRGQNIPAPGCSLREVVALQAAGITSFQNHPHQGPASARNPVLGDILVVIAQVAAATQFIVEEKYMAKYRVPALLVSGCGPLLQTLLRTCGVQSEVLCLVHVTYPHTSDSNCSYVCQCCKDAVPTAFKCCVSTGPCFLTIVTPTSPCASCSSVCSASMDSDTVLLPCSSNNTSV